METAHPVNTQWPRIWLAGVLAGVQLLAVLDGLAASLALPEIGRDLGLGPAGLAWTLNAVSVALAGGLLVAGRLGDVVGRRPLFLAGTGLLALGSLLSGLAPVPSVLFAGRALVGAGAALAYPSALALMSSSFPDEPWRTRAFAASAVAGASGSLGGAVYGGLVTGTLGWRWVFLLTIPLTLLLGAGAARLLPRTRHPGSQRRSLDLRGALLGTVAMTSLVSGIIGLGTASMSPALALSALVLAAAATAALVAHERRTADPLVPSVVIRSRRLLGGCSGMAACSAGWTVVAFVLAQQLQRDGWTATRAGLALLPASLGIVVSGVLVVPRLRRRLGSVRTATASLAAVAGCAALLAPATQGSYVLHVLPVLVVLGAGLSGCHTSLMEHTLRDGPPSAEAVSAAVLESSTHVGGAVSVAVYASVLAGGGYALAYGAAGVFAALGCVGVLVLQREARTAGQTSQWAA